MPDVLLLEWPESVRPAYRAARACRSNAPSLQAFAIETSIPDEEAIVRFLETKILPVGHFSVLEGLSFQFMVRCSLISSHQLVRHRYSSPSQRSYRAVRATREDLVVPDVITDEEDIAIFLDALDYAYRAYERLLARGVDPEWARGVLPTSTMTQFTFSMNGRALIEFSRKRQCKRAQGEAHSVAEQMRALVLDACPLIGRWMGPPCQFGPCQEGGCGSGH
jgi:thymidylate synthase (FAD)